MPRHLDPNHQYYVDSAPIVGGQAFFGEPNQDPTILANQIVIFSTRDLQGGTEIAQPVPTDAQGRVNTAVYMAESEYSYQVFDSLDNLLLDEALLEPLNVAGLVQADIDMDGFHHINVGDATANNQYMAYGQGVSLFESAVDSALSSGVNAIVADLPIAPVTLTPNFQVAVRLTHGPNTIASPTFKLNAFAAKTIIRDPDAVLSLGDTGGPQHFVILKFNAGLDKWELTNPIFQNKYAFDSIPTSAYAPGSVDNDAIGNDAVNTDEVVDGAITLPKMLDMVERTLMGRPVGAGAGDPVHLVLSQILAVIGFSGTVAANAINVVIPITSGVSLRVTAALVTHGSNPDSHAFPTAFAATPIVAASEANSLTGVSAVTTTTFTTVGISTGVAVRYIAIGLA